MPTLIFCRDICVIMYHSKLRSCLVSRSTTLCFEEIGTPETDSNKFVRRETYLNDAAFVEIFDSSRCPPFRVNLVLQNSRLIVRWGSKEEII